MLRRLVLVLVIVLSWGVLWPASSAAAEDENGMVISGNGVVAGSIEIEGVAEHPTFRKWQIDLMINGDPTHATFLALGEDPMPTLGRMATVDSALYPDGDHLLRLRVVHSNLNYDEYFTPVSFANGNTPAPMPADPAPSLTAMDASAAPADGVRRIEVDLSDQTLTAYQGDVVVLHTLVSTGRPATPTVLGQYNIRTKVPAQRMRGPGYDLPNVPSVMYFFAGYAIHGAYWHNNFGQTMSHGCVNMRLDEAAALYAWADVGTEVYVRE
ncbi:MAG: L,D-transpeptidase [Caldilineaceae bacterium]|nr:L,D-transpeptidase [Caldilineaceae bacterium]